MINHPFYYYHIIAGVLRRLLGHDHHAWANKPAVMPIVVGSDAAQTPCTVDVS